MEPANDCVLEVVDLQGIIQREKKCCLTGWAKCTGFQISVCEVVDLHGILQ
jgi:hypothetical protein